MKLFHPLLTKDERKSLSKPERQALRKARREARDPLIKGDGIALILDRLKTEARELIIDAAEDAIPGEDKMDEVLSSLAASADQYLVWTWAGPVAGSALELLDGPAAQALVRIAIRPQVQKLYEELRDAGLTV